MQKKMNGTILKNFSYSISSNFLSLLISVLITLIVPKIIGVEEYGYWQLYLFYSSYVGFLHFGWNDGIYLRYGGESYDDLDKNLFYSQFWMLFIFQVLIATFIAVPVSLFVNSTNGVFIFSMVAINLVLVNTRYMLLYVLQATNRIKDYSRSIILERIIFAFLIFFLIISGVNNFSILIFADLIGKIISLIFTISQCKDIVFRNLLKLNLNFKETFENISVGINLVFANIASKLIIGIVKIGIQSVWSVSTFGQVSLTLSVSNLLMTFINAVSLVIYPVLRRINIEKLARTYNLIRTILVVPLLGILIIYYPLKELLSLWLPHYSESLELMAIVFPAVVFESKVALLSNTFLKTLRKEKILLKINVIVVIFSFITTIFITFIFKNLNLSVLNIVFLLALKSILAEVFLAKYISIDISKDIFYEVAMCILFIYTSWFINSWFGVVFYLTFYLIYLLLIKEEIIRSYHFFKFYFKN